MAAADAVSLAALRGATLADVLAHKAAAAPDRRRVLLLEHSMTVAEALQARDCARLRALLADSHSPLRSSTYSCLLPTGCYQHR